MFTSPDQMDYPTHKNSLKRLLLLALAIIAFVAGLYFIVAPIVASLVGLVMLIGGAR